MASREIRAPRSAALDHFVVHISARFVSEGLEGFDTKSIRRLFEVYHAGTNDKPSGRLLLFYKSSNAFLRATIAIRHLDDPLVGDRLKWVERANQYLRLAQTYLG